ncbi:tumor necrosis factor receptor superfamily member 5-like [Callorhinchus milii]|uniref:Tumor necrosis factor receptor superfamily member 5-like n=1 Tax=Callorhinchus milii TaxID=7868 RepID=A0A4W3J3M2_CALMI|nr:tumor necrosis factor receptor superfamily member 5-like [Callorhinchus milii]|eukprot:gi/632939569/ref/XP_007910563.1/ PREDICTED: tumor necrosis factor receptor superfamily member 5-like [Callorhinchus milii]
MGSSQAFWICLVWFLPQLYQAMSDNQCDSLTQFPKLNKCCSKCPPGQYTEIECTAKTDSKCRPCAHGYYQSTWSQNECRRHTVCNENGGFITKVPGTSINNTVCQCKLGKHCPNKDCEICENNKVCHLGYGVVFKKEDGAELILPVCEECQPGYFSNTSSATDPCRKWTNCGLLQVQNNGTPSRDVICSPQEHDSKGLIPWVVVLSTTLLLVMLALTFYFGCKQDNRTRMRNAFTSMLKCKHKIQMPVQEQETTENGRILATAEEEDKSPEVVVPLITV